VILLLRSEEAPPSERGLLLLLLSLWLEEVHWVWGRDGYIPHGAEGAVLAGDETLEDGRVAPRVPVQAAPADGPVLEILDGGLEVGQALQGLDDVLPADGGGVHDHGGRGDVGQRGHEGLHQLLDLVGVLDPLERLVPPGGVAAQSVLLGEVVEGQLLPGGGLLLHVAAPVPRVALHQCGRPELLVQQPEHEAALGHPILVKRHLLAALPPRVEVHGHLC